MECENMRMPELKAIARERRLRNYSRMRKVELVELFRNNPLALQTRHPSIVQPTPQMSWEPIDNPRPLLHKKWIYLNDEKWVSLDHKSRPNLINGTVG